MASHDDASPSPVAIELPELRLSVDWGMRWPLSDYAWFDRPDWENLLSPELLARVLEWQNFFNIHGDLETGTFGGEQNRKWFDLEGVRLLNDLTTEVGHLFRFKLVLWF
jgi:hypothetical protein